MNNKKVLDEKMINKFLTAENIELKKINFGLKEAYDKEVAENQKYRKFFPLIDRIRQTYLYRGIVKIRNKFKGQKDGK